MAAHRVRTAEADDIDGLIALWSLLFDETADDQSWAQHAREWFGTVVHHGAVARFPVIEVGGQIAATAIGTLELGVPNPQCPRGRVVRLANVITLPEHRGRGCGTALVRDVVGWARSIDADRVDLSATPEGQRLYDRAGFVLTSAPRMKLVL